jgi:IclR family acetate operon transcriptional repressor
VSESLLERSTRVIEAIVEAGEPIGPRALARATGIDRSAVGRILKQLAALGMLTAQDGSYSPGTRLYGIGRGLSAQDSLPRAAHATLAGLVQEFDETAYVCTWRGNSAVFLYEGQCSKPLRYVIELGRPVALHAGAAGRAILAGLPQDIASELISQQPLPSLTDATMTDLNELLEQRSRDLEVGYSVSRQERVEGGFAIASPYFDHNGTCLGSVVLSAPLSRLIDNQIDVMGQSVHSAADGLSARLGAHEAGLEQRPEITE